MTLPEIIIAAISGPAGAGAILGLGKAIDAWRRRRDKIDEEKLKAEKDVALARIAADEHDDEREHSLIGRLSDRVQALEHSKDDCQEQLSSVRADALYSKAAAQKCEQEHADTRRRLSAIEKRTTDLTGQFRVAARREVRRAMSEQNIPAQPGPIVTEEVTKKPEDPR